MGARTAEADVIVVGAGPAGSATATHLAKAGLSVLLVEKSRFPREKVCGDGLTPRTMAELTRLGVDLKSLAWKRNRGLRIHVLGRVYHMEWPDLVEFPGFGMTLRRSLFDQFLVEQAMGAGVRFVDGTTVVAPRLTRGWVAGVVTKNGEAFEAPVVVSADGSSSRLAVAMGIHRNTKRPLGLAVRTYYRSPMADDEWIDSMLELRDGTQLLHGYAWSFPMGDGTCNVGVGLPNSSRGGLGVRELMTRWIRSTPPRWGFNDESQTEPLKSAALPMGFNRRPVYHRGLLLVGDAAGMISPFTGEGISYAMESGRYAAEHILQAHSRGIHTTSAQKVLTSYGDRLREQWGGYFRLGLIFAQIIAHPSVMRAACHYGLPIPAVRMLTHRTLAHLGSSIPQDGYDRVVHLMSKVMPKA